MLECQPMVRIMAKVTHKEEQRCCCGSRLSETMYFLRFLPLEHRVLRSCDRSWQPDSYGTGGILADDYRQIQWFKIDALTGGTSYMPTGLGLRPWYLADFSPLVPLVNNTAQPPAAAPSNSPFPDFTPAGASTPFGASEFQGYVAPHNVCVETPVHSGLVHMHAAA